MAYITFIIVDQPFASMLSNVMKRKVRRSVNDGNKIKNVDSNDENGNVDQDSNIKRCRV